MPKASFYSEPDRYFPKPSPTDNVCIAPTSSGRRCRNTIIDDEMILLLSLEDRAQACSGEEQSDLFSRALLLRTCSNSHRERLECHESCLEELVRRQKILCSKSSEHRIHRIEVEQEGSSVIRQDSIVMRPSNELRARDPTQSNFDAASKILDIRQSTEFTSFLPGPKDSLDLLLPQPVASNQAASGYVYALFWPSEPEFVKIGYAKSSMARRLKTWNKCHRGAEILYSAPFMFPERMERIIHLQLIERRHCIMACVACGRCHIEWFKISPEEAIQTIRDWRDVTREDALYAADRTLSMLWCQRICGITSPVNAQSLLKIREAETSMHEDSTECSENLVTPLDDVLESQMKFMTLN
jgi:ferredoxin